MGRKTFESIGRALPNRRSIVVTRSDAPLPDGVERATSLESAIERARETDATPFVVGGGEIYKAAMPLATDLYVTIAEGVDDAGSDTFFPEIDSTLFEEVDRHAGGTPGLTFLHYRRRA
jgi:dihydrofolate reductase